MIELIFKDIEDKYIRENFKRITEFFRGDTIRKAQWKFFEIAFFDGATNYRFKHNLGFRPKDFLITGITNSEAVTFNVDLCDKEYFDITVSGACVVRFFAGTYGENL